MMDSTAISPDVLQKVTAPKLLMTRLPAIAAFAVFNLGLIVLVGWTFGIQYLKSGGAGIVSMNPATALCFMLLGLSLWKLRTQPVAENARRLGKGLAAFVMLIGVFRLVAYVLNVDIGPDRVLFADSLELDAIGVPNRMAPNTAALFVLSAAGLLMMDRVAWKRWRPTELHAIVVAMISILALLGYAYGVGAMYRIEFFIPMALNTSLGFLVLSIGILTSRTCSGLMAVIGAQSAGGVMARRILPGAIVIAAVLAFLRLEAETLGLVSREMGGVVMAMSMMVLLTGYIWYVAAKLNQSDNQRLSASESLREQHALLQAILESVSDGIAVADMNERFIVFNSAGRSMISTQPPEGTKESWMDHFGVFKPDMVTKFPIDECCMTRALKGECVEDQEQFVRNARMQDGVFLSVSARPLKTADGSMRGGVAVFRNITERKRMEQKLRAFNAELERRVEQRTQELTRTIGELQQFAYVASHDLQEPLRMVMSYLQLLERRYKDKLDGDAIEFINYAVDGASRMKQLIIDLLEYSRVERKGGQFVEVDVGRALSDAMRLLQAMIDDTGATITQCELPCIVADPAQLRQLFLNLLGNAMKFRSEAPPQIHVSADEVEGGWMISVRDNGIGINPEHTSRIFDMFQRLHTREQYPGTGIGLAICRKIVERHDGTISVVSQPGQGATFQFFIPTLEVSRHDQQAAA